MKLTVTITREELKKIVVDKIKERFNGDIDPIHVQIETKSTQNYKSEWETADFRATYQGEV
jgi:hypothetical protein